MVEASPETSCEHDPSSNGSAECGVGVAKGMIRSARSALEERLGVNIPDNHPIHTWLCQYGGAMQRRYTVGDDGRTAFERVHGRRCAQHVAEFGERVWWMPLSKDGSLPNPGDRFSD